MKANSLSSNRHLATTTRPRLMESLARKGVLRQLARLERGSLTLVDGDQEFRFGNAGSPGPCAKIAVHDQRFYADIAFGGSIGAGEAYMNGFWRTDDLGQFDLRLLELRYHVDASELRPHPPVSQLDRSPGVRRRPLRDRSPEADAAGIPFELG